MSGSPTENWVAPDGFIYETRATGTTGTPNAVPEECGGEVTKRLLAAVQCLEQVEGRLDSIFGHVTGRLPVPNEEIDFSKDSLFGLVYCVEVIADALAEKVSELATLI